MFPQAESTGAVVRRLRKRQHGDMRVRLRSIEADAEFVGATASLYARFPLYANLRHGAWYAPAFAGAGYFKSTDGHSGQWDFSLGRLNLHVARAAAEAGGLLLVDSTRSGKAFPDALSVTVPVWCAVINRVLGLSMPVQATSGQEGDASAAAAAAAAAAVFLPPWVSPSEAAQIEARIDGWVERVAQIGRGEVGGGDGEIAAALRGRLTKPLRPLWLGQERVGWDAARRRLRPDRIPLPFEQGDASEILLQQLVEGLLRTPHDGSVADLPLASLPPSPSPSPQQQPQPQPQQREGSAMPPLAPPAPTPPFIPVLCLSASDPRSAAELRGSYPFAYIPGAGDDHENWASVPLEGEGVGSRSCGGGGKQRCATLEPQQFWAHRERLLALAVVADGWTGDGAAVGDADYEMFEALVQDVVGGGGSGTAVEAAASAVADGASTAPAAGSKRLTTAATVHVTDSLVMLPAAPVLADLLGAGVDVAAAEEGQAGKEPSPWRSLGFQFDAVLNCADWAAARVDADSACAADGSDSNSEDPADTLWEAVSDRLAVQGSGAASDWYCAVPVVGGKRGLRRQGREAAVMAASSAAASGAPQLPPSAFSHWQRSVLPRALSFVHEHVRQGRTCAVVIDEDGHAAAVESAAGAATVVLAVLLALYEKQLPAAADNPAMQTDAPGRWSIPMVPRSSSGICSARLQVTKAVIRSMQARLQLVAPLACPPRRLLKQLTTFFIAPPVGTVGCGWEWWQASLLEHCCDSSDC